jgi:hypothetical protein
MLLNNEQIEKEKDDLDKILSDDEKITFTRYIDGDIAFKSFLMNPIIEKLRSYYCYEVSICPARFVKKLDIDAIDFWIEKHLMNLFGKEQEWIN